MTRKIIPTRPAKARQSPPPEGGKTELLMILGSGPALAYVEQLLAEADANGALHRKALEQQQLDTLLGTVETTTAVQVMLEPEKD